MASIYITCLFLIATVQVTPTVSQCPTTTLTADPIARRVQSPNYPEYYEANTNCNFTINTTTESNVIHISSVDMHLFGDQENCGDKIEFFNGFGINNNRIKMACGKDMFTVQSTGAALFVRFTSDMFRESKGFVLKYWAAAPYSPQCPGPSTIMLTENPVYIYIPGNSTEGCEYRLSGETDNHMVYVDLPEWDEPKSLECGRGMIMVYDGLGMTRDKMIDACGPERPFWSVGSSGQILTISINFTQNPPADSEGFYVRAMALPKTQANCDEISSMPIGPTASYLWYPIFSSSSTNGSWCDKNLLAPGTTARVTVANCSNLPFTAYEGVTGEVLSCDDETIRSSKQDLLLEANSSAEPVLLKVASFDSYCNGGPPMEMEAKNDKMETLTLEDIPRSSNCMRRFKAPTTNEVVKLILEATLEDEECVSVYDGINDGANRIYRMCGEFEKKLMSTGQYLTFGVMVNSKNTAGKVEAKYFSASKTASCPEEMNILAKREKMNLTSPNFPMEYPLDSICKWRFVSYRPDFIVVIEVLESDLPEDCTDVAYVNDGETHEQPKLGEWCGNRKPVYRGSGQTLLLTFDADHVTMMNKKGFQFRYYADNKVAREITGGTDVLAIAGVLTIIVVAGGLIFITYHLCTKKIAKRRALKADRQPLTQ